ncbi:hypothetical protein [Amorphus orientalis]|uniref:Uncharacterized protein n=1 Tax=Amorphus orientalis TaxID=649198 RepID=A0AAE3VPX9_9HYPH|nr:hypothetical protein [Amorphus orientalis]MDQ0316073.1 hypothetical protein [Amorphus orientalis]
MRSMTYHHRRNGLPRLLRPGDIAAPVTASSPTARRAVPALACALVLSACSVFYPAFQESTVPQIGEGYKTVSQLVAKTELGDYRTASSYAAASDTYAEAIANFATARAAIDAGAAPLATDQAKTDVLLAIDNCIEAIEIMAEDHRTGGLPAKVGYRATQTTCATPYRVIQ